MVRARRASPALSSDTSDVSSLSDLSDDSHGYSDLDNISEGGDDDEEEISAMENAFLQHDNLTTPAPPVGDNQSVADDADADDEDGDTSTIASNWFRDGNESVIDAHGFGELHEMQFDLRSNASSTSTEGDEPALDSMFPDIFVPVSQLDPSFRREIHRGAADTYSPGSSADFFESANFDDSASDDYLNFGQLLDGDVDEMMAQAAFAESNGDASVFSTPFATPFDFPDDVDEGEDDISLGESTDDEPNPEPRNGRTSPIEDFTDSDVEVQEHDGVRIASFRSRPLGPKPVLFRDPRTGKRTIGHPISTPGTFPRTPMPGDFMLSGALEPLDFAGVASGQAFYPLEALFPLYSDDTDSDAGPFEADTQEHEDHHVDVDELLNLDETHHETNEDTLPTPVRPITASSDFEPLSHLGSHNVTAFRRDQHDKQLLLSTQATQDSLALAQPYNTMCIKGIKSDRFDSAAAPLTPARRHKRNMSEYTRSPLEAATIKRKASADTEVPAHKRYRSISDVNSLRL